MTVFMMALLSIMTTALLSDLLVVRRWNDPAYRIAIWSILTIIVATLEVQSGLFFVVFITHIAFNLAQIVNPRLITIQRMQLTMLFVGFAVCVVVEYTRTLPLS